MGVQSVFVVAAVPLPAEVGVEERRSAFWLNRLFGSGRKRKLSRDIGEFRPMLFRLDVVVTCTHVFNTPIGSHCLL